MFLSLGLCGAPAQSRLRSEVVAQHAPAAWAHINVLGEYGFREIESTNQVFKSTFVGKMVHKCIVLKIRTFSNKCRHYDG